MKTIMVICPICGEPIDSRELAELLRDLEEKPVKRVEAFTVIEVMYLLAALASLTLSGLVLYAAWHFVSKYW